ncbi:uncharacterized protein LOC129808626 isoform X2 [Phlebotomus papatasi]|uniref:uncharacterized protein LOC129808626 isoform X2 n=1 Tax=Phlebotomus papatasi TaxID=29031 RepID=UPI00248398FD|nr:uncharacterized protein LOC129808626 isoform X2 [Phlebotomus papatasi]
MDRMEYFFTVNSITEDKKKASVFITFAGKEVYKALKAIVQPRKVQDLTYKEIKEVLMAKFVHKKSQIGERFKFHQRFQEEGESISDFATDLQYLAQSCSYGNFLDEALRDRFVCGLRNSRIQTKLIDDDHKKFNDVLQKALNMELTEENVKLIQPTTSSSIAKVSRYSGERRKVFKKDYERGSGRETPADSHTERKGEKRKAGSPYIRCFNCGKWGSHIAAECKSKGKSSNTKREERKHKEVKALHSYRDRYIDTESDSDSDRLGEKIHSLRLSSIVKAARLEHKAEMVEEDRNASVQPLPNDDDEDLTE